MLPYERGCATSKIDLGWEVVQTIVDTCKCKMNILMLRMHAKKKH